MLCPPLFYTREWVSGFASSSSSSASHEFGKGPSWCYTDRIHSHNSRPVTIPVQRPEYEQQHEGKCSCAFYHLKTTLGEPHAFRVTEEPEYTLSIHSARLGNSIQVSSSSSRLPFSKTGLKGNMVTLGGHYDHELVRNDIKLMVRVGADMALFISPLAGSGLVSTRQQRL